MAEYIEREALIQNMQECKGDSTFNIMATGYAYSFIKNAPSADVVEVVRCSECKWFIPKYIKLNNGTIRAYTEEEKKLPLGVTGDIGINCGSRCLRCLRWEEISIPVYVQENDYCSYGERRCKD